MSEENKNYSVITDAKVKDIRKNQYDNWELITETVSPLTRTSVEQRIPLYATEFKSDTVSQDVIDRTTSQLRKALDDDTIVFNESMDDDKPETLTNWVKDHVGQPIKALYTHNGRVSLNQPSANNGSSNFHSMWRPKFKPEFGEYDPEKYIMSFFDAQTDKDQQDIAAVNVKSDNVAASTYNGRKRTTFFGEGTIDSVLFTSGYDFNVHPEDKDIKTIYDMVAAVLSQDAPEVLVPKASADADKELAQAVTALANDERNGLYALYHVLGGYRYLNNVSDERRDTVSKIFAKQNIKVVTMYVRTNDNKVFQLSVGPMRRLDISNPRTHGFHIEFLSSDFKTDDVMLPLVEGGIIDQDEVLNIAKEMNLFDEDKGVVLKSGFEAIDFLNGIFQGKTIRYRSTIADDRGTTDRARLGSQFVSISAPADKDVEVEAPIETEDAPTEEDAPVEDNADDILSASNPWAVED